MFIPPFVKHLVRFYLLAIVNNAALNSVQYTVSEFLTFNSFEYILRSRIEELYGKFMLNF